MNRDTLLELAAKWARETVEPVCEDASEASKLRNAESRGHRKALARAADDLRTLVRLFCDPPPIGWGQYVNGPEPGACRDVGAESRRA